MALGVYRKRFFRHRRPPVIFAVAAGAALAVGPLTVISGTSLPAITVTFQASLVVGPLAVVSATSIPAITVTLGAPPLNVGPLTVISGTTLPGIAPSLNLGPFTVVDGTALPAITVTLQPSLTVGPLVAVDGTTLPAIVITRQGNIDLGPLVAVDQTTLTGIGIALSPPFSIGPLTAVSGTTIPAITVTFGASIPVGPLVLAASTTIPAIGVELALGVGPLVPVADTTLPGITVIHLANPVIVLQPVTSAAEDSPASTITITQEKVMADIATRMSGLPRRQARTFDSELELRATGQSAITSETTLTPYLLVGDGARMHAIVDVTAITGDCTVTVVLATNSTGTSVQDNLQYVIPGGDLGRFTIPIFVNLRGGLEGDTGRVFATLKVNPGTTVTLSAYFAKAPNDRSV